MRKADKLILESIGFTPEDVDVKARMKQLHEALNSSDVFNISNVDVFKREVLAGCQKIFPWSHIEHSTLGGEHRVSVILKVSLDPHSEWTNGIYQNSRYSMFHVNRDGTVEQFSCYPRDIKFRKTTFKDSKTLISKLGQWADKVQ